MLEINHCCSQVFARGPPRQCRLDEDSQTAGNQNSSINAGGSRLAQPNFERIAHGREPSNFDRVFLLPLLCSIRSPDISLFGTEISFRAWCDWNFISLTSSARRYSMISVLIYRQTSTNNCIERLKSPSSRILSPLPPADLRCCRSLGGEIWNEFGRPSDTTVGEPAGDKTVAAMLGKYPCDCGLIGPG
jgi:hypothetical protein